MASKFNRVACQVQRATIAQHALRPTAAAAATAVPIFLAPCLRSSFSTTSTTLNKASDRRKARQTHYDPYAAQLIQAKKDALKARSVAKREEKSKAMGDPIRGVETPFLKSFDYEHVIPELVKSSGDAPQEDATASTDMRVPRPQDDMESHHNTFNHGLSPDDLEAALHYSRSLTEPVATQETKELRQQPSMFAAPVAKDRRPEQWRAHDKAATEAIRRIVSLAQASSADRSKANTAKIIKTFGRHETDNYLKPKAPSAPVMAALAASGSTEHYPPRKERGGPDTGSSEVQIGILTAKIRVLATRFENENRNDKATKRGLRLLLHRRQKLLKYMERKERGSERWFNMLEKLGITEAAWKGEISVE